MGKFDFRIGLKDSAFRERIKSKDKLYYQIMELNFKIKNSAALVATINAKPSAAGFDPWSSTTMPVRTGAVHLSDTLFIIINLMRPANPHENTCTQ